MIMANGYQVDYLRTIRELSSGYHLSVSRCIDDHILLHHSIGNVLYVKCLPRSEVDVCFELDYTVVIFDATVLYIFIVKDYSFVLTQDGHVWRIDRRAVKGGKSYKCKIREDTLDRQSDVFLELLNPPTASKDKSSKLTEDLVYDLVAKIDHAFALVLDSNELCVLSAKDPTCATFDLNHISSTFEASGMVRATTYKMSSMLHFKGLNTFLVRAEGSDCSNCTFISGCLFKALLGTETEQSCIGFILVDCAQGIVHCVHKEATAVETSTDTSRILLDIKQTISTCFLCTMNRSTDAKDVLLCTRPGRFNTLLVLGSRGCLAIWYEAKKHNKCIFQCMTVCQNARDCSVFGKYVIISSDVNIFVYSLKELPEKETTGKAGHDAAIQLSLSLVKIWSISDVIFIHSLTFDANTDRQYFVMVKDSGEVLKLRSNLIILENSNSHSSAGVNIGHLHKAKTLISKTCASIGEKLDVSKYLDNLMKDLALSCEIIVNLTTGEDRLRDLGIYVELIDLTSPSSLYFKITCTSNLTVQLPDGWSLLVTITGPKLWPTNASKETYFNASKMFNIAFLQQRKSRKFMFVLNETTMVSFPLHMNVLAVFDFRRFLNNVSGLIPVQETLNKLDSSHKCILELYKECFDIFSIVKPLASVDNLIACPKTGTCGDIFGGRYFEAIADTFKLHQRPTVKPDDKVYRFSLPVADYLLEVAQSSEPLQNLNLHDAAKAIFSVIINTNGRELCNSIVRCTSLALASKDNVVASMSLIGSMLQTPGFHFNLVIESRSSFLACQLYSSVCEKIMFLTQHAKPAAESELTEALLSQMEALTEQMDAMNNEVDHCQKKIKQGMTPEKARRELMELFAKIRDLSSFGCNDACK